MNVTQVINIISGLLFVISGLVLIFHIRYPVKIEPTTLLGIILIVIGVSMAFKVPFMSSLALGISIAVLILSLNGLNVSFEGKSTIINGTLEEGKEFEIEVNAGKLNLKIMNCGESKYEGKVVTYSISKSSLRFMGEVRLTLCKAEKVSVNVNAGSVRIEVYKCLKELKIENNVGSAKIYYTLPKACEGKVSVENNLGSVDLDIKVPEGVKVIYSASSTLGKVEIITPEGTYTGSGSWGEGEKVFYLKLSSHLGSVVAKIEK